MQLLSFLALTGLAGTAVARSARYAKKGLELPRPRYGYPERAGTLEKRAAEPLIAQNNMTASKSSVRCIVVVGAIGAGWNGVD